MSGVKMMGKESSFDDWRRRLVIVRGGGDIASGTIHKLTACGFPVLVLEVSCPSCIRRTISFCEAVVLGETVVEGVRALRVDSVEEAFELSQRGEQGMPVVPVLVDPDGEAIHKLHPKVLVDAILAKKNLGTRINDAPIVIGLGPGFTAGYDVHAVVETKRGHDLGRVIYEGKAADNTGVPGKIAGYGAERVIHSPAAGKLHIIKDIGEETAQGEVIAMVGGQPVTATIPGIVRGMIREGYPVHEGLKIADIDPRISEKKNCLRISDKARCVSGGVLEAVLHLQLQS